MYIINYDYWNGNGLAHKVSISNVPYPPKGITALKNFKVEKIK